MAQLALFKGEHLVPCDFERCDLMNQMKLKAALLEPVYGRPIRPKYEQNATQLFPVFSVSLVSFILLKAVITANSLLRTNYSNSLTTICLTRNILNATSKKGIERSDNLAIWDVFLYLSAFAPTCQIISST